MIMQTSTVENVKSISGFSRDLNYCKNLKVEDCIDIVNGTLYVSGNLHVKGNIYLDSASVIVTEKLYLEGKVFARNGSIQAGAFESRGIVDCTQLSCSSSILCHGDAYIESLRAYCGGLVKGRLIVKNLDIGDDLEAHDVSAGDIMVRRNAKIKANTIFAHTMRTRAK